VERSRFMRELKAKLASETSEEMMARIEAEERIEEILVELSDSRGFRVVEDYRYTSGEEETATDFILQFEDVELRILVRYSRTGMPVLSREDLDGFTDILQQAQATTALVLVWAAPELPTLAVTPGDIDALLSSEELVPAFLGRTSSLKEAVLCFVESQTKEWRLRVVSGPARGLVLRETQAILEQRLQEELEKESERAYRVERKVLAQKAMSGADAATMARVFEAGRRAAKQADAITQDLVDLVSRWENAEEG